MIGHRSSYLGRRIQRVWWPRCESFDNVAVRGCVIMCDFIVIWWKNNEFGSDSVPIRLQRWIDSMCIECASPKPDQVWTRRMRIRYALNSVLGSSVKGPLQSSSVVFPLFEEVLQQRHGRSYWGQGKPWHWLQTTNTMQVSLVWPWILHRESQDPRSSWLKVTSSIGVSSITAII